LSAVADALGTPAELISRSAAARAAANGTTTDDVLSAWSGGAPIAPAPPQAPTVEAVAEPQPTSSGDETPTPATEPLPVATPTTAVDTLAAPAEVVEPLEPVDVSYRLKTAGRVGVWTGAVLGLFAFVAATAWWSQSATVAGEVQLRPVLVANATSVMIGIALASFVFGALVASLARAAASWTDPAMALSSSKSSTAWVGAFIGLALGFGAGALLANGFGSPIEGSDGLVQLPVLATLAVMLIGGALLGWITTLATQFFGVPVAIDANDTEEVDAVRKRLGNAIGIPLAGLTLLLALVLPFAWALIRSHHLSSIGAAVIAIIAASGILGFAALAGTKPNMRISKGEFLVALAGIGIVLLLVFAVISNVGSA
jgi:hypothetical protein